MKVYKYYFAIISISFGLSSSVCLGQNTEHAESFYLYWSKAFTTARESLSTKDFSSFCKFYSTKLDSLRGVYAYEMRSKSIDSTTIITRSKNRIMALYNQFEKVKALYPSSVNENRVMQVTSPCDSTGCGNIGFENGTLSGWNAFYGYNNNFGGTSNSFNITNITGGAVGAVTEAANDPLTATNGFYNPSLPPNSQPDYQVYIMSGTRFDALTNAIPVVSPYGGTYSAMLGDSTQVNMGVAILSKTFLVQAINEDFTYQYAVVLENPFQHTFYEQPFFQVAVIDGNGDTIPICGQYSVVSSGGQASGFTPVFVPPNGQIGGDTAYYRDWTIVSVPLKAYVGQCVTIVFEVGDCSRGGHFGYAYVDATCAPFKIEASSPGICDNKPVNLIGPPGFVSYNWTGPPSGIVGANNTQSIYVDSAGTYQVISVPVTGASCADTLTVTLTKGTTAAPVPSFTATNLCAGQQIRFINTSQPLSGPGISYYWDFYNLGAYQDSTADPTWSFIRPGTYDIKLYEISDGCGADTIIPITVYAPPTGVINGPSSVCAGDSVTLSAHVISSPLPTCYFHWNTGSTNASITVLPVRPDTAYYVTLASGCIDTLYSTISIDNTNPIQVCCDTTITAGDTTQVLASGELTYAWTPASGLGCNNCARSQAFPRVTTVYYATGTDANGCRLMDSVLITVESCGDVYIPNAFTPNYDGLNDYFGPIGKCISNYTLYIFNRWGDLIYKDTKPWDGTRNGQKVLQDTYVYKAVVTTWDTKTQTVIGDVTVIK
jgi:gliding motility-associated-like protein